MSKVERNKCDGCGIVVENPYATKDWIQLSPTVTIIVSKGSYSTKTRCNETHHVKDVRDFCNWKCMIKFVESK